jgi:hypothetical protein
MPITINKTPAALSPEDCRLMTKAADHDQGWNRPACFSDEEVTAVKTLFKNHFGESVNGLSGRRFYDGIALTSDAKFFALVFVNEDWEETPDEPTCLEWQWVEVECNTASMQVFGCFPFMGNVAVWKVNDFMKSNTDSETVDE